MNSKQFICVKELVFQRKISITQGQILEWLILNSKKNFKGLEDKLTSEMTVDELAEKAEITSNNLRYHIRILEGKGFIIQAFLFSSGIVYGYKAALKKGVSAIKARCYILKLPRVKK